MASIKVSYKDLKKDDNGQLATLFGGKSIVSKNTGFETIEVEKITEDPKGDFVNLFPFNEDSARSIAESMLNKGYDKTQVIHVAKIIEEPETIDNPIRIDGAHRCWAAKEAGIEKIPVYIHTFETRVEALIYAYELQLNRRNLEAHEKFKAFRKLDALKNPGRKKDDDSETSGKSSVEIGKAIGESSRTVERMRRISKFGCEELTEMVDTKQIKIHEAEQLISQIVKNIDLETIENLKLGKISVAEVKELLEAKKAEEKAVATKQIKSNDDFEEDFVPFEDNIDDMSESLNDNEGNPRGLNFNHSDGIERPSYKLTPEEDDERTRERRSAYLQGFSDGFYKALVFACAEISKGRTPEDVYKDDRVSDLSPSVIEKFELPEDADDIVGRW